MTRGEEWRASSRKERAPPAFRCGRTSTVLAPAHPRPARAPTNATQGGACAALRARPTYITGPRSPPSRGARSRRASRYSSSSSAASASAAGSSSPAPPRRGGAAATAGAAASSRAARPSVRRARRPPGGVVGRVHLDERLDLRDEPRARARRDAVRARPPRSSSPSVQVLGQVGRGGAALARRRRAVARRQPLRARAGRAVGGGPRASCRRATSAARSPSLAEALHRALAAQRVVLEQVRRLEPDERVHARGVVGRVGRSAAAAARALGRGRLGRRVLRDLPRRRTRAGGAARRPRRCACRRLAALRAAVAQAEAEGLELVGRAADAAAARAARSSRAARSACARASVSSRAQRSFARLTASALAWYIVKPNLRPLLAHFFEPHETCSW